MQRPSSPVEECASTVMAIQPDSSVKPVPPSTTPGLTGSKQTLMSVKVCGIFSWPFVNVSTCS